MVFLNTRAHVLSYHPSSMCARARASIVYSSCVLFIFTLHFYSPFSLSIFLGNSPFRALPPLPPCSPPATRAAAFLFALAAVALGIPAPSIMARYALEVRREREGGRERGGDEREREWERE